jgi:hypothetical protein
MSLAITCNENSRFTKDPCNATASFWIPTIICGRPRPPSAATANWYKNPVKVYGCFQIFSGFSLLDTVEKSS